MVDEIARERIAALDRILLAEIRRIDDAITTFSGTVAERFVAGNEFRTSLNDVQTQMATRRELEAFQNEYRNAHSDLLQSLNDLRTNVAVGPSDVRDLVRQEARQSGRAEGIQSLTANPLLGALLIVAGGILGHFLK